MSGGRLVVVDRAGRDVKRFPLAEGLATLGSDPACDIRIMLPTVSPHHATVVVHANQTVVRNVCEEETLVNGRCVSVAALRHGDVISIGGRQLRWEYADASAPRLQAPEPALHVSRRKRRGLRRGSGPAPAAAPDPALRRAIEMSHRASMPGSAGGKQVAIVQPQRRDIAQPIDKNAPRTPVQGNKRPRTSKGEVDTSVTEAESDKGKRKSNSRVSPKSAAQLHGTTKATLWIESRKRSPRRRAASATPPRRTAVSATPPRRRTAVGATPPRRRTAASVTPLRLAVLKRAQSAHKLKLTKIEEPLKMDETKQAALRLMTGQVSRAAASSPALLVKRPSPAAAPRPAPRRSAASRSVTILEISDSDGRNSSLRNSNRASRSSGHNSPRKSVAAKSPRKSALKDPSGKRGSRKAESIKFDLSNLENYSGASDAMLASGGATDDDATLRYSSSPAPSPAPSPSPRRSIHARSAHLLQRSLRGAAPASPAPRSAARSSRGSMLLARALGRRGGSAGAAQLTRTLSPREPRALESYSIVDLVSVDTEDSVYDSAGSGLTTFGTPRTAAGRQTRSTIDATLLGSSTPYAKGRPSTPRSRSDPSLDTFSNVSVNGSRSTIRASKSKRSKSLSTPENTEDAKKHITVNSTRISRASRSRSRLNDTDLLLLEDDEDSPRTSKRISTTSKSIRISTRSAADDTVATPTHSPAQNEGISTPENRHSPEEASTPVLSIQSLLDSSQSSFVSQKATRKGRTSFNTKRKTIGGISGPRTRIGAKSKSMSFSVRKTRLRLSSDSVDKLNHTHNGEVATPKSAVKLVQEAVKNKHSTAKKPQSKRSIIDDLNESDIVKQLFSSPVKRKLSQSMTELSRRREFADEAPRGRRTLPAASPPAASPPDHADCYTPELFVSPLSTPRSASPAPRRPPRARRSIKNDFTDVTGLKNIFARSPRNRLSDVRVKQVFASSPKNDLRRVTGVKALFQTAERRSPRNELDDVRGVKKLFKTRSPANDLRNVSGVKRMLKRRSPKNDLSDVRGVKRMFRRETRNDLSDVSGVEELFNLSNLSSATVSTRAESLFDQLVGKQQIRAVYSKTFSTEKTVQKTKTLKTKSLHASLDQVTNTDSWLEQELNKRLQIKNYLESLQAADDSAANRSKARRSKSEQAPEEESGSLVLPLKKRSLAAPLPLKKRALGHSTPLKARAAAAGLQGLARMSPIAALHHSTAYEEKPKKNARSTRANTENVEDATTPAIVKPSPKKTRSRAKPKTPKKNTSPKKEKAKARNTTIKAKTTGPVKTRNTRTTKAKTSTVIKASPVKKVRSPKKVSPTKKVSPVKKVSSAKKTKATKKVATPVPVKTTRSRRKDVSTLPSTPQTNTKKRGAKVVVAKKSPLMSPKPRASRKRKQPEPPATPKPSVKKTRATRNNQSVKDEKPKTPKSTRAKVLRATLAVSKPSPQLKPRAARRPPPNRRSESPNKSQPKTHSKRITRPAEVQPKTRRRKTNAKESEDNESVARSATKTRKSRKTDAPPATNKKASNNKEDKSGAASAPASAASRKRKSSAAPAAAPAKLRKPAPVPRDPSPEPNHKPARGRKAKSEIVPVTQTGKRKRATAVEPSPVQERSKRARGKAAAPALQPAGKTAGRSRRR
ncbi:serine/arginine repetitive matrix protein 2-like [Helicoverpa zea]|uniref:serine/arginine repetitive matrix protein 2-like n=1 Tax=Helicoverpa zea TaxID=7113 RepID=UPI001F56F4FD|nr:serine/arginine repetitive matrix protein 2-like [Helicoverpa zea]XP_047035873.1 serine/arginine repetitive matrix protein 2-like [Helicoverpa zea]XP_047035874.1 serine/arginine repetitive matrix protein 2-like [Helicoverpa zea]